MKRSTRGARRGAVGEPWEPRAGGPDGRPSGTDALGDSRRLIGPRDAGFPARSPHLNPPVQVGDRPVRELALGRHLDFLVVADHLDQATPPRAHGDDERTGPDFGDQGRARVRASHSPSASRGRDIPSNARPGAGGSATEEGVCVRASRRSLSRLGRDAEREDEGGRQRQNARPAHR